MIGTTIGNYKILRELGTGGMGTVYLAENLSIGNKVAIKMLHPTLMFDTGFAHRLVQEGYVANKINHPAAVKIYENDIIAQDVGIQFDDDITTTSGYFGGFGVAIVGYSALDKADRVVSATVTFTVIGRPGPPGQPDVTDVASHRATVTWAPADPKGTPVTNY